MAAVTAAMIVKLLAERGSAAADLVFRSSLFTRSPNLWALVGRRVSCASITSKASLRAVETAARPGSPAGQYGPLLPARPRSAIWWPSMLWRAKNEDNGAAAGVQGRADLD